MEIEFLRHFGFPLRYIDTLKKAYGDRFLPLQEKCIQPGKIFEGAHLLAQAPTSSGKTMLAELLFLHHVQKPKSTLLLLPSKALANQRFQELKQRYQPLGFKICLSTRDHPFQDRDIRRGDFHLAVIVYEKLLSLLIDSPDLLNYTGVCVMDELHYLLDPTRGEDIDLLLTRIKQEPGVQRLGLSAVTLPDEIARQLALQRIVITERPVELLQGVLCHGTFTYRKLNSKQRSTETFPFSESGDDGEAMLEAAEYFYHQGESTLLFFPTRKLCYTAARRLALRIDAEEPLNTDVFAEMEETGAARFLSQLITKRITVHTSDLTTQEREAVEHLIQQNEVRLIVATTTLAEGINFPVSNVITSKHMYTQSAGAVSAPSIPSKCAITYERLQNMTGRAGRLGYQEKGRGMMVSCFPGEVDGLLNQYEPDPNQQPFHPTAKRIPERILKAFALFKPDSEESCAAALEPSLYPIPHRESLRTGINRLMQHDLLGCEQGIHYLTGAGYAAATHGITLQTAQSLLSLARQQAEQTGFNTCALLAALAMQPEIMEFYIPLSTGEWKNHCWTKRFYDTYRHQNHPGWLDSWFDTPEKFSRDHHCAFKKVMLCMDWMDGTPLPQLEPRYECYAGFLFRFTLEMAWLLGTFSDILSSVSIQPAATASIPTLRTRLQFGIPPSAIDWCEKMKCLSMPRSHVLRLIQIGFHSPTQLAPEHRQQLQQLLPDKWVDLLIQAGHPDPHTPASPDTGERALQIDPSRPDQLYIQDRTVQLTKLQSDLIHCLAERVNRCVHYESLMNRLWGEGFGDRKSLNRLKNQIIRKCISVGGELYRNLIEVVPGVGLVLKAKLIR